MDGVDEARLWRRIGRGDRAAIDEFYQRTTPWLAVRLRRRCAQNSRCGPTRTRCVAHPTADTPGAAHRPLAVLIAAPDPDRAARLSTARINTALRKANRRDVSITSHEIQTILRAPALRQPAAVQQAFAAIVAGEVRLIEALNAEIDALGQVVAEHFGRHPDADLYTSQPGLGVILGARVLAEFGDDPNRYTDAKARNNYAGTSPITRASGTKKTVLARHARNDRLGDAVHQRALGALRGSPGARNYYDALRARNIAHHAALRQVGNRLVGILHGCLKTRTRYDENTAWAHQTSAAA